MRLSERVAALMRAGGWRKVAITAPMGVLGTDVVGVGADGRRWLMRCHHNPDRLDPADVRRLAASAREMQRGEVVMLVVDGAVPVPVLNAARRTGVTIVDAGSLSWWAGVQQP